MSTENQNIDEPNCLAEVCEINGMKRTGIFTAVKEAIASRLGYNQMDPKLQNVLSQTSQKHQKIIEWPEQSDSESTDTKEKPAIPPDEIQEPANDPNFDESAKKVA